MLPMSRGPGPTAKHLENTIYSFGRIDDILLPANLAAQCHPCLTNEQGLSDHLPLLAHIPTYILNASIPRIAQSQPTHNSNHQVNLVRPISITDQNAFLLALLDPSHGVYQQLEDTIQVLKPAHAEALAFLDGLQHTSAKQTLRLKMICNRLAPEVIEEYAQVVSNLIQSTQELAFKTCSTKITSPDHRHHNPRSVSRRRLSLSKKLNQIKSIQRYLHSPHIHSHCTPNEILVQNYDNLILCNTIHKLKDLNHELPLGKQLEDLFSNTKSAIVTIDQVNNRENHKRARVRQQKLINCSPKKAHKENFRDKNTQPRAGLQALRDPYTGILETEPIKQTHILEKFYKDSWKKVNIKNGRYLPEQTPRNYPWEHPPPTFKGPLPDPFKFESQITKDEAEGKQTRN